MYEHFEVVIENLGDVLFEDDNDHEDLRRFISSKPDEEQDAFAKAVLEIITFEE